MFDNDSQNFQFEGPTVEETIRIALKDLKVSKDDVEIKVISEEKKGLFGMKGAKPAKIIVSLRK
jgi:spoIIIJ-associated protein